MNEKDDTIPKVIEKLLNLKGSENNLLKLRDMLPFVN